MSKHTLGPWLFQISPDGQGRIVSQATSQSVCRWLGAGTEDGIKNAHLIAAAPDLLEALERAEESLCLAEFLLDEHQDDSPNFEPAILKARAAIAKARGEA